MINVQYRHRPGQLNAGQHIATIARSTLIRFSNNANRFLHRNPRSCNFGIGTDAPEDGIRFVLGWMNDQAGLSPSQWPPGLLPCPETFEAAVWTLHICYALQVHPWVTRGRGGVWGRVKEYVEALPLTRAEFAMVWEVLGFDEEMKGVAVRSTEVRRREWLEQGGRGGGGVPDWEQIMEYWKGNGGLW